MTMRLFKNLAKSISYNVRGGVKLKGDNNNCNIAKSFKQKKMTININGQNNSLAIGNHGTAFNLDISIVGNNNTVLIGNNFKCLGDCKILIIGSDNNITLGNDVIVVSSLIIYNHDHSKNCRISIGDKTSFYKTEISNYDNESSITIGEDCMFAYDTIVYNTDGHSIFQDGKLINRATNLIIGNHVWCGWGSTILKNSNIADGCIVGKSAVVSGKFNNTNCVIAGVPAKEIKSNIIWDRKSVNETLEKVI